MSPCRGYYFELINFVNDSSNESVTSTACKWVKRSIITNIETNDILENISVALHNESGAKSLPTEDMYNPIQDDLMLPPVTTFMDGLAEHYANACALDTYRERVNHPINNSDVLKDKGPLRVLTTMDKIT